MPSDVPDALRLRGDPRSVAARPCADGHTGRVDEGRRDARTVEITLALLLGATVAVLPMVAMWLAGRAWGMSGPDWSAAKDTVDLAAVLAGAAVTVGWLVRSRV